MVGRDFRIYTKIREFNWEIRIVSLQSFSLGLTWRMERGRTIQSRQSSVPPSAPAAGSQAWCPCGSPSWSGSTWGRPPAGRCTETTANHCNPALLLVSSVNPKQYCLPIGQQRQSTTTQLSHWSEINPTATQSFNWSAKVNYMQSSLSISQQAKPNTIEMLLARNDNPYQVLYKLTFSITPPVSNEHF